MKQKTSLHNWILTIDRTSFEKIWWRIIITNIRNMFYTIKLFFSNFHLLIARTLAEGKRSRFWWPLIFAIALVLVTAFPLGCFYGGFYLTGGNVNYGTDPYKPDNVLDAAYYLLFTNGGQNLFDGSHLLGILITSLGIIFIAILTSMITNYFERIGQSYLSGESTFLMKNHVVIIGTSDVIYSILNSKKGNNKHEGNQKTRFLIMTSKKVEEKRREILSFLNDEIPENRIIFMYGDRTSQKDINRLSLAYAREVFVIGDSEENDSVESYRDSNNMDCMARIAENQDVVKLRNNTRKLPCHVMFEYQTTFVAFQFSEMGDAFKEHIDFLPFNFYDMWAQKVLVAGEKDERNKKLKYQFLDKLPNGYINKDSEESVHLIIVGITKMGIALGIQASQVCHFPNFIYNRSRRTRITFIDAEADVEFNYMNGRYHNLFNNSRYRVVDLSSNDAELNKSWTNDDSWLDIEWEFVKGRVESPYIQEYIKNTCEDKSHIVTLAVCLTRSHKSIATAMFLPESIFQNCLQILVYQRLSGTIIEKVANWGNDDETDEGQNKYRYSKLRPFGMIDCGYDPHFEQETLNRSKYIAYVYDSYYRQDEKGNDINDWDEKLEKYDGIFRSWGEYSNYEEYWSKNKQVWEKISCQLNALSIRTKLRSIGIDLSKENDLSLDVIYSCIDNEIKNMQMVEHNRWNMEKLLTGYRTLTDEETLELNALWKNWHVSQLSDIDRDAAKKVWANKRKQLKEWPYRAHLDICSNETLISREEEVILQHDIKLNTAIPYILEKSKTNKKMNLWKKFITFLNQSTRLIFRCQKN